MLSIYVTGCELTYILTDKWEVQLWKGSCNCKTACCEKVTAMEKQLLGKYGYSGEVTQHLVCSIAFFEKLAISKKVDHLKKQPL